MGKRIYLTLDAKKRIYTAFPTDVTIREPIWDSLYDTEAAWVDPLRFEKETGECAAEVALQDPNVIDEMRSST